MSEINPSPANPNVLPHDEYAVQSGLLSLTEIQPIGDSRPRTIEPVSAVHGEEGLISPSEFTERAKRMGGLVVRGLQKGARYSKRQSLKAFDTSSLVWHGLAEKTAKSDEKSASKKGERLNKRQEFYTYLGTIAVPSAANKNSVRISYDSYLGKDTKTAPQDDQRRRPKGLLERRADSKAFRRADEAARARAYKYRAISNFGSDASRDSKTRRHLRKAGLTTSKLRGNLNRGELVTAKDTVDAGKLVLGKRIRDDKKVKGADRKTRKAVRASQKPISNWVLERRQLHAAVREDSARKRQVKHREKRDLARTRRASR